MGEASTASGGYGGSIGISGGGGTLVAPFAPRVGTARKGGDVELSAGTSDEGNGGSTTISAGDGSCGEAP